VVLSLAGDPVVYRSHTLGEATNNLAEVDGIHEASDYVLSYPSDIPASVPIYIFVDNRLAINIAVGRAHATWCRTLAEHTRSKLRSIAQTREVYLFWVPGHADIEGNELSDKSAKYASAGHTCFGKPPNRFAEPTVEAPQRAPAAPNRILEFLKSRAAAAERKRARRVHIRRSRTPRNSVTPSYGGGPRYNTRSRSRRNRIDRAKLDNNAPT